MTTARGAPGLVVLGQQRAANDRVHAEQLKVVAGDRLPHREARAIGQLHRGHRRAVGQHVGEDLVLRLEVEVVGIGAGRVLVAVAAAGEHVDQPIGPLDRQRPEQQGVDEGEQCRVEADADRERGNGDQGERRAAPQPAQGKPDVREQIFEHGLQDDNSALNVHTKNKMQPRSRESHEDARRR